MTFSTEAQHSRIKQVGPVTRPARSNRTLRSVLDL
jgi:hypothetical protein